MKCNELKAKLASKDAEVKERTENTIKCFELVKDFVVDKLIQEHIDDEFNGDGAYICPQDVYTELFSKLEIDTSELYWHSTSYHYDLSSIEFKKRSFVKFIVLKEIDPNHNPVEIKQDEELSKFKIKFDGELFKKLIIDHVLKFGFKHKWIENIRGQQVKTNRFIISRSFLEKKCCSEQVKPFDGDGELNDNLIGAVIIVTICILAFIYCILA